MICRVPRLLLAGLLLVPTVACQSAADDEANRVRKDLRLVAEVVTVQASVPRNATFESLLLQQQLAPELAASVVEAIRGVFNPRHLQANQTYWVMRTLDGLFREFRYQIDADNLLRIVHRSDAVADAGFEVEVVTLPKEYERTVASARITPQANSLIAAFKAVGENQLLPLDLAQIFAGQVDFNSELQQGDRFDVLFERAVRNGEFVGYGNIQAAVIEVGGRRLTAYRFDDADGNEAGGARQPGHYYDETGRSLRRAFLRTPLDFNPRVTSGFSYNRFHPVHGTRRPHLGVDFGAPTGTPVMAVSDGVVTTAGWAGEAGRLVRIRHAGGYETLYLHLNGFASGIRPGVRVAQRQVIGYVGSSGTATGPHLDYRVVKDGKYLNPMTAFSGMPSGEPISPDRLPAFHLVREQAQQVFEERLAVVNASASLSPSAEPR